MTRAGRARARKHTPTNIVPPLASPLCAGVVMTAARERAHGRTHALESYPAGCAHTSKDGGSALAGRGCVQHARTGDGAAEDVRLPEQRPTGPLGARSRAQQEEELRQLATLAQVPAPPTVAGAPSDPVDALAAWLLGRADLSDLSTC